MPPRLWGADTAVRLHVRFRITPYAQAVRVSVKKV